MPGKNFKSAARYSSKNVNVDPAAGVIRNVAIAEYGENKNGSFFDELFLNDLVTAGNKNEKGIKSRFGHPNMCSTSLGTYIGRYNNFTYKLNEPTAKMTVFADLTLDPITKTTSVPGQNIMMFDYITQMATNNPDVFGNSIHIFSDDYEKEIDGKMQYLHKLQIFKASDLVDDPAATTELFSSNSEDLGVLLTEFLDENPQIFEVVNKNPEIIKDFFERYNTYQQRKSTKFNIMNMFSKKFHQIFGGKGFDIEITLADASIVTVKTENEKPAVGDDVVDSDGNAVADKEHLLPDGSVIVTVAGKITEIKDKPADPPATEVTTESMNAVAAKIDALSKKFDTAMSDVAKTFDTIADQMKKDQDANKLKFSTFASKTDIPGAEAGGGANPKLDLADRFEAAMKETEKK